MKAIQADSFGASYPRVIQLQYYTAGNGQLLVTYAGGGKTGMPVYRSTDNGETFHLFSELTRLRGQPTIYELPTRMGEFPGGPDGEQLMRTFSAKRGKFPALTRLAVRRPCP